MCENVGYRLITIFEDEWINKTDIVKSRLSNILDFDFNKSLYARKCIVKNINSTEARNFIERNHIQGYINSSIKIGAFYKDELVSVMTFSKASISKGSKHAEGLWELSRFCSSGKIVGIASKMLSFFKKNYEWKSIFSYTDKRWSNGNLYEKIGFDLIKHTKPNYWYVNINQSSIVERYHRFNFRKNILSEKLQHFDSNLTEVENMRLNGYDRIWDCGNIKYIMKKEE
jgi:hypothetical protein